MPPKKKEEVDISQLPSFTYNLLTINYLLKQSRADKLKERLLTQPRSFLRFIQRSEIINTCKEKGLFVDPNNLTEK